MFTLHILLCKIARRNHFPNESFIFFMDWLYDFNFVCVIHLFTYWLSLHSFLIRFLRKKFCFGLIDKLNDWLIYVFIYGLADELMDGVIEWVFSSIDANRRWCSVFDVREQSKLGKNPRWIKSGWKPAPHTSKALIKCRIQTRVHRGENTQKESP